VGSPFKNMHTSAAQKDYFLELLVVGGENLGGRLCAEVLGAVAIDGAVEGRA
jgi:hypothetical protein